MAAVVTMTDLLKAGVHFGHQTRRWNPKMGRYLWGERNGIYIIDLQQTITLIDQAYTYVRDTVSKAPFFSLEQKSKLKTQSKHSLELVVCRSLINVG